MEKIFGVDKAKLRQVKVFTGAGRKEVDGLE